MHASGGRPGARPWAACKPVQAAASAAGNGQNASAAPPAAMLVRTGRSAGPAVKSGQLAPAPDEATLSAERPV